MAGANISITVDDAAVRAALRRLSAHLTDLTPAFAEIGEVLVASTKQRFADQAGPDGVKWKPNTALTLARYLGATKGNYKKSGALSKRGAARLGSKKVLTQTGALGDTIRYQAGARQVVVGTNLVYGAVHQFGNPDNRYFNTPRGAPAPIPPRPYLGISDQDRTTIERIIERYLRG